MFDSVHNGHPLTISTEMGLDGVMELQDWLSYSRLSLSERLNSEFLLAYNRN